MSNRVASSRTERPAIPTFTTKTSTIAIPIFARLSSIKTPSRALSTRWSCRRRDQKINLFQSTRRGRKMRLFGPTLIPSARSATKLSNSSKKRISIFAMPAPRLHSINMPQKVNPDVLELTRGKTARVIGNLQALLVLVKGLPLAYNRDLQEDKPGLFDALRKTGLALNVLQGALSTCSFNKEAMRCGTSSFLSQSSSPRCSAMLRGMRFKT